MTYPEWNYARLGSQGFGSLDRGQRRRVSLGLRLTPAALLASVCVGLWLRSPMVFAILGIFAAIGGLGPRHPFDLIWQWGVRRLVGGPPLPPNPTPRRLPFMIAAPWLLTVAFLYWRGDAVWAFRLGVPFLFTAALAAFAHFCVMAEMLRLFRR